MPVGEITTEPPFSMNDGGRELTKQSSCQRRTPDRDSTQPESNRSVSIESPYRTGGRRLLGFAEMGKRLVNLTQGVMFSVRTHSTAGRDLRSRHPGKYLKADGGERVCSLLALIEPVSQKNAL